MLLGDDGVDAARILRREHDPRIPFQLDIDLADAEPAQPVEVADDAVRKSEVIAGCELGDPLAAALQVTDVGAQGLVDLLEGEAEVLRAGDEELLHASEGHARIGQTRIRMSRTTAATSYLR